MLQCSDAPLHPAVAGPAAGARERLPMGRSRAGVRGDCALGSATPAAGAGPTAAAGERTSPSAAESAGDAMPGTISVSERGKVAGVQDDHPMHRSGAICTGNMGSLDRICRKMKKVCRAETPTKQGVFEHTAPCRAKIIWARWAR